mgnify:CR=1 FL=1
MRIVLTLFLFCVCMSIKAQQQDMTEMKKAIDLMQGMYDITFVYDSSLVTAKPQAFPSAGNSLKENLERIFGGTGIKWEIRDEYVLLFHPNNYTFSGYVCEDSGETLINVTVLDLNTLKGTPSNEHGFFSSTLPEGKHKLYRLSGCGEGGGFEFQLQRCYLLERKQYRTERSCSGCRHERSPPHDTDRQSVSDLGTVEYGVFAT